MSDFFLLFGALALGLERWTEVWMNLAKTAFGEPKEGQNLHQVGYRALALFIGVGSEDQPLEPKRG